MYPKKIIIFIALLFIAVGTAYFFSDNSASEIEKRQGPYVDSLAPDNRPSFTARRDTVPQPVGENFAPGTALLRTTILSTEEVENEIGKVRVRVDEVLGYGSSTPPIAGGTEFIFDVSYYLEQNPEFKDQIKEESEINVLVSYQEGIRMNESDKKQSWTLVELRIR